MPIILQVIPQESSDTLYQLVLTSVSANGERTRTFSVSIANLSVALASASAFWVAQGRQPFGYLETQDWMGRTYITLTAPD